MATTQTLDFFAVLSESKKIVNAHSRHFLALSVLFLLPLSFSLVVFPTLHLSIFDSNTNKSVTLLRFTDQQRFDVKPLFLSLVFALTALILSICATSTITYSVFHGFYGRPVKLVSAVKSLLNSFLRLFGTVLCTKIIILAVSILVSLIVVLTVRGMQYLGFEVSYFSTSFNVISSIALVILLLGLVYLHVNWALAYVVVVVESSWGLEPLRRSSYLVKGMRRVSLSLLLFFGLATGLLVWCGWQSPVMLDGVGSAWKAVAYVLRIVATSAVLMVLLLYSVAAHTVLYMYSKALHGELAGEIVEEFAREYVSLPFDDEKVPHVIYVVQD